MPLTGDGYLAGEFPGGTTTVEGVPVSATVRILYRPESGQASDGALVAQVQSAPDGTWRVEGLRTDLLYDVVGRKEGFNDVIVANVTPTSMIEITYSGAVVENETFTGAVGFLELVGGIPPYSVAAETPFPSGLFPVVSGRNLIIDGTTGADEVASFDVKVTSSNGSEKIIPLQLVVGFEAPANFKAETVVVDDVFSVSLTWEVTNSTQQVKVYRSATPFDMGDLPEPIATLSGTSTTYTDDDVIEDDHFYYMVTAVCEQYELRSNVIAEDVRDVDPHWENVVALLHFDGSDNGTTFPDERGRVWTGIGDAKTKASLKKWGAAAGDFNGVNSYISTPHSSNLNVGSANYTIEAWVYLRAAAAYAIFASKGNSTVAHLPVLLSMDGSGTRAQFGVGISSVWNIAVSGMALPLNEWVHLAGVRSGGSLLLFQQGVLVGTATAAGPAMDNTSPLTIGANAPGNSFANVVVDDFRLTTSVARYTENFTPPTKPFPNY